MGEKTDAREVVDLSSGTIGLMGNADSDQVASSHVATRRVLVVEDDAFTRSLVARVLTDAGFDVSTAATAVEAAHEFADMDPDAVVLDIHLGEGVNGVDLANRFRAEAPWLAVIAVSNYPNPVSAGLPQRLPEDSAFINKSAITDADHLLEVVESTLRNQGSVSTMPEAEASPVASLGPAQIATLRMLAMGWSNAEIAERRGSTVRSVERMVHKVFAALDLNGDPAINPRVEAVKMYAAVFGMPAREESGSTQR